MICEFKLIDMICHMQLKSGKVALDSNYFWGKKSCNSKPFSLMVYSIQKQHKAQQNNNNAMITNQWVA